MSDLVEHPSHYNAGSVETIDAIKSALGDAFLDYCRGNVLKYVWRCRHKGSLIEDLRKAAKYLEWAIEEAESEKPSEPQELAIPDGWRELHPHDFPRKSDMRDDGVSWKQNNTDSDAEYKYWKIRVIRKIEPWPDYGESVSVEEADANASRKIETENTSGTPNSSLPDPGPGYRLLSKDPPELVVKGDEFWCDTYWEESENWRSVGRQCSSYYRRKIEPTEWIPKVGDRVRVNSPGRIVDGLDCVIIAVENGKYTAQHRSLISNELNPEHLELIEAAQ